MPVHARFDGQLLWIEISGMPDDQFLDELNQVTRETEERLTRCHRVVDLSSCIEIRLRFETMHSVAKMRQARTFPNSFRSAIIAPRVVHLGFARMYQTILNHPQIEVQIFEALEPALAWLGE